MRTLLRRLLTALVVAACAAQPIALDACRAACDTARSAQTAVAPPCHHASSGGAQIDQPVRPCSQDHAVVPADHGAGGPAPSLAFASPGPSTSSCDPFAPHVAIVVSSSGPPSRPIAIGSNLPLRV